MAHASHCKVHDAARQTTRIHDFASQHKEWHSQQGEAVGAFDQVLRQDLRIKHVHVPHQRSAAQQQRERDGNTQRHRTHQGKEKYSDRHGLVPWVGLVVAAVWDFFRLLDHHQVFVTRLTGHQAKEFNDKN